jgi:hypothetical protein
MPRRFPATLNQIMLAQIVVVSSGMMALAIWWVWLGMVRYLLFAAGFLGFVLAFRAMKYP